MVLPREIAYLGAISARSRRCEGDVVRSGSEMIHNKQKHRLFYREISRYKTVMQVPLGHVPVTVTSPCINVYMSVLGPTGTDLSQISTCARVSGPEGSGLSRLTPVDAVDLVDFSATGRSEPSPPARRKEEEHVPNGRGTVPPARRQAKLDG